MFEKYNTKGGLKTVTEELKQRVVAKSEKVKRYINRVEQLQQNFFFFKIIRMGCLKKKTGKGGTWDFEIPDSKSPNQCWKGISDKDIKHNDETDWIRRIKSEVDKTRVNRRTSA